MKLSTICFALIVLAVAARPAHAQFAIDTARGLVGKKVIVTLREPSGTGPWSGRFMMTALMQLSNPTVFYPERFIAAQGDTLVGATLKQIKDSIYQISFEVHRGISNPAAGDTIVSLEGEALAGSDTTCLITLSSIDLDGAAFPVSRGVVVTHSIGPRLPYVRFAILEQNYPNPVQHGHPTTWAYRIDKRSDVVFHFYNLLTQEIFTAYLGDQDIGPHVYVYTPSIDLPSGTYLVRLVTNSGNADKVMNILQ